MEEEVQINKAKKKIKRPKPNVIPNQKRNLLLTTTPKTHTFSSNLSLN
jgi:hypothetical protein